MRVSVLRTSDGFVVEELCRYFRLGGHTVREMRFETRTEQERERVLYDYGAFVEHLLEFQPEAVVSLNHRGLNDPDGKTARILAVLGTPTLSWHLDNPFWNLDAVLRTDNPYLTVFSFDRSYVEPLRARLRGASVEYLPNATDPELFHPRPGSAERCEDLSFVGNLCLESFRRQARRLFSLSTQGVEELMGTLERASQENPDVEALQDLVKSFASRGAAPDADGVRRLADEYQAFRYRRDHILRIADLDPVVYGDADWLELMSLGRVRGRARYREDLPDIYRRSRINVNLSRPQVRTGLNQRFFDVPAAGGFLLTDFREEALEFFEEGNDIAVFRSPEDLVVQAKRYLEQPALRERMAERAREKVLSGHTYAHRVDTMAAHALERSERMQPRGFRGISDFWAGDAAFVEACRLVGQGCFRKGDMPRGSFYYRYVAAADPSGGEAWIRLAAVAAAEGDLDRSQRLIGEALKREPHHPVAHAVSGVNALKRGDAACALRHFRRSIDFGNRDPGVMQQAVALRSRLQRPVAVEGSKPSAAFLVADGNQPFGGVRVLLEYANRLADRGYPVHLLTEQPQYSDWFPLRVPVAPPPDWSRVLAGVRAVVLSQHAPASRIPRRRELLRVFLAQHGVSDREDEAMARHTFKDREWRVLAVSDAVRRVLHERFGVEAQVLHSGVDRSLFQPGARKKSSAGPFQILYGFSPHPLKGGELGLETLRLLSVRHADWNVALFGLGPRPKADFPFAYHRNPDQDLLARLYADSQVFLSTSRVEGFGLPPLEAMACGCPVVTTQNGGNADYCVDGENALLCDYGDAEGLQARVERLAVDSELWQRLRNGGLKTVERFDWDRSVGELARLLFEV